MRGPLTTAAPCRLVRSSAFGTAATVEDYEWVRRALGIARWNVVGTSYGTTVAMTLLASHPEAVRSAVLDSLNPPDAYLDRPWSARVARARDAFLAACGTDPTCRTGNPDLPARYREAIARLGDDASTIPLPAALPGPGDRVRLTPSLFEEVVGRLVYYPPSYAGLPHLIAATRDGDLGPVGVALATLLAAAKRADHEGAFIAVECRDRPRWREPAGPAASPLDLALMPPGVCTDWSALGPEPEVPLATNVPVLMLQGEFDRTYGQTRAATSPTRWARVFNGSSSPASVTACGITAPVRKKSWRPSSSCRIARLRSRARRSDLVPSRECRLDHDPFRTGSKSVQGQIRMPKRRQSEVRTWLSAARR